MERCESAGNAWKRLFQRVRLRKHSIASHRPDKCAGRKRVRRGRRPGSFCSAKTTKRVWYIIPLMSLHTFHVRGMHCKACVALIEGELREVPEVSRVKASLNDFSVEVAGEFGDKTAEHVARDLSEVLKPHGYTLLLEKQKHAVKWSDFNLALPIAVGFIALFIILQKLGIVNLVSTS